MKLRIIMAAMMLFMGHLYAQKRLYPIKLSDVIITGRVTDSLIKNRPDGKTTVTVQVSKYPFSHPGILGAKNSIYNVEVKYNEPFSLSISPPANRCYMYIYYEQDSQGVDAIRDLGWSSIDNVYILDQGDNINADLGRDYFRFSGKGADKLNCESEIYKHSFNGRMIDSRISEMLASLGNKGDYKKIYSILDHGKDSCLALQKIIVEKYRKRLGDELSDIMLANCYGIRYFWELKGARQCSDSVSFYDSIVNSPWYKDIDFSLNRKMDARILAQAPIYVDFLFEKIRMDNYNMEADGTRQHALYYKNTFNMIKKSYQGIIRDKLFALFFINNSKFPNSMNYLDEALNLCGPTIYRDILVNLKETQSKGKAFFPFALPNTQGKIVKLEDLGNKVIILDFWYTGCENCINLHSNMEKIHDKYKNNPQVVFVSVNIDRDKQQWIKSVLAGKYTDPDDLNLYTGGQAIKHPLLAKYAIASFPTVFILKNGKIFSSNPPRPNNRSLTQGSAKDFTDLMKQLLQTILCNPFSGTPSKQ